VKPVYVKKKIGIFGKHLNFYLQITHNSGKFKNKKKTYFLKGLNSKGQII
jgi:hypothetical protein